MRQLPLLLVLCLALSAVAGEQEIAQARSLVLSFYENQVLSHRTNRTWLVDLNVGDEQECVDVVQAWVRLAGVETNQNAVWAMDGAAGECIGRMMRRAKGGWCTNDTFLSSLLAYYVSKRDPYSYALDRLASPRWLNRHAEILKPYALSTTNHYLCEMLDSISLTELRDVAPSNSLTFWPLWALARKGDTNAENQLLKYAMSPTMSLPQGVRLSGEELGNSGSEKLLRLAARELRSEEYVEYICAWGPRGNPTRTNTVLRRQIWATAIYTAMRNEEALEMPYILDLDEEGLSSLDPLEKWCTRKFGIEYPKTPRKRLPIYGLPDLEAERLAQKFAMELRTTPLSVVLTGSFGHRVIELTNVNAWVVSNRARVPEWQLGVPDKKMPIDTAITILKGFIDNRNPEDPAADNRPICFRTRYTARPEPRFGVDLTWDKSKGRGRFRSASSVPDPYSEVMEKYGRRRMTGTTDWYECEGSDELLAEVLPILIKGVSSIAKEKTIAFSCSTRDGDRFCADSVPPFFLLNALQVAKEAGFEHVIFLSGYMQT